MMDHYSSALGSLVHIDFTDGAKATPVSYTHLKGIQVNTTPYNFVDDDAIADYARDAIYALKNAEIIKGYEDNTVVPEGSATRAEIAQMVANLIVLLGL